VLAPETRFEHADNRFLVGDDLRLPHQDDGHDAHSEDAEAEDDAGLRLCSGHVQHTANPFHESKLRQSRGRCLASRGLKNEQT